MHELLHIFLKGVKKLEKRSFCFISCDSDLELSVGGGPLEHDVDVGESGEGGLPADVLCLLAHVLGDAEGKVVVEVAGAGQVEGVVDDLGAVVDVDLGVVRVELGDQELPVLSVVVDAEVT